MKTVTIKTSKVKRLRNGVLHRQRFARIRIGNGAVNYRLKSEWTDVGEDFDAALYGEMKPLLTPPA